MISPLAYVDPAARLGQDVEVKPFAYIEGDVEIGDRCVIHSHASILAGTTMGADNVIYQNAVICARPQDFHFTADHPTHVVIGQGNHIRENVVIAGSLSADGATRLGNGNFLMDRVHLCHDVLIHDRCVLGIGVSVAGGSEIDDCAIQSSGSIVHHDVHIGRYSLLQSGCRVTRDVPPYAVIGGNPASYHGVNYMVLRHQNMSERIMRHIANTYRLVYTGNFSLEDAVSKIPEQIPMSSEIDDILHFLSSTKHGIVRHMNDEE